MNSIDPAIFSLPWAILPAAMPKSIGQSAGAMRGGASHAAGSIVVLRIVGPILKYRFDAMWFGGTSSQEIESKCRELAADASVSSVVLRIDSPGGQSAGVAEAAEAVRQLSAEKPVVAFAEDLCASAAYFIASQARSLIANELAIVGSIGAFIAVYDISEMFQREGIRTIVLRSGQFKGTGTPGDKVTDAQLAQYQNVVDAIHAKFIDAVKSGRPQLKSTIDNIADGSVFVGPQALAAKLVDRIGTLEDAIDTAANAATAKQHGTPTAAIEPPPRALSFSFNRPKSAKMFLTRDEAAATLHKTAAEIDSLVRAGRLREMKDGASVVFKTEQVESLI